MAKINITDLAFEEAIKLSRDRFVVLPGTYYGTMQGKERQMAFSIAVMAEVSQLKQALDTLNRAMETGQTFEQWKDTVREEEVDFGLNDARLNTIFRTNVQSAYMRGHYEQQALTAATRPYLMYDAINDSRTRPNHAAMDGYIARYNDPIWHSHRPPMGYNCRCTLISLTAEEATARGFNGDGPPYVEPDQGWDYDKLDHSTAVDKALKEALDKAKYATLKEHAEALIASKSAAFPWGEATTAKEAEIVGRKILDELEAYSGTKIENMTSLEFRTGLKGMMEKQGVPLGEGYDVTRFFGVARSSPDARDHMERLAEYMPTSLLDTLATNAKARQAHLTATKIADRAHYSVVNQNLTYRNYDSFTHEFLHHVQSTHPGFDDVFQQLHEQRTKGDPVKRLRDIYPKSGYAADERAREDQYPDAYFGREYDWSNTRAGALEVLTMTGQGVLGGIPAEFDRIKADPQLMEVFIGGLYGYKF